MKRIKSNLIFNNIVFSTSDIHYRYYAADNANEYSSLSFIAHSDISLSSNSPISHCLRSIAKLFQDTSTSLIPLELNDEIWKILRIIFNDNSCVIKIDCDSKKSGWQKDDIAKVIFSDENVGGVQFHLHFDGEQWIIDSVIEPEYDLNLKIINS